MAIDLLIRNVTLVSSSARRDADIAIDGGMFVAIAAPGKAEGTAVETIDGRGLIALPGLIDGHVHFREPGLEHEEDWASGTCAAVMGGVTTVLDMPNTVPPTDTPDRARAKVALAAASAYCDFGIFGLVGQSADDRIADLADSGLVVGLKAFLGPTTGGLSAPDDDGLRDALVAARAAGLRVAFHAEDRAIIAAAEGALRAAGRTDAPAHLESRPVEAELDAIDHLGRLLEQTGAAGHVLHLSSAAGLAAVEGWRARGVDLTCETTPHHALLGRDAYALGGVARVNPPFRGEPDGPALMTALADRRIDCLASDHAPHLESDKRHASIWDVSAGFAGVETLLPLLLTAVNAGRLSLERLVLATSEGPARTWGLSPRKGAVEVDADADLTLVDLDRAGVIRAASLHGKNNLSPFEGWPMRGAAVATIVRGRVVMRDGRLVGESGWGRPVGRLRT